MLRNSLLVLLLILWLPITSVAAEKDISVSVAIPLVKSERRIEYKPGEAYDFAVVITNTASTSRNIWMDWNSWGYDNLSFVVVDKTGNKWIVRKKAAAFTKNFPAYWALSPGDSVVLPVSFSGGDWDGLGFIKKGEDVPNTTKIWMQAIYEIAADTESKQYSVWTGRVISSKQEYVVYNWSNS